MAAPAALRKTPRIPDAELGQLLELVDDADSVECARTALEFFAKQR
jgi:hypothetical protein